ncbi:MAG: type II toxin-antitoxin system RelE/ParE family toxin [Thermomicrobiales bacterium]
MPSSRRLRLSPEADDDIAAIARYSAETWGSQQMAAYVDRLYATLDELVHFPGIGRVRDEIAPGLRSHPTGQHVAFYRVTDDELIVVRVVHSRRDAETALRSHAPRSFE